MPNTFIDNRDAWLRTSDIDYLGQFVKVWLAFNAWYRSAYTETQDRKIINEMKWQGNSILNCLRPMLEASSDEAEQFRAEIGLLHQRLENYEIHTGKADEKKRISLCSVYLNDNPPNTELTNYYGYEFRVERLANRQVKTEVKHIKNGVVMFSHNQTRFDPADLETQADFSIKLTAKQQGVLRQIYSKLSPWWVENLATYQNNGVTSGVIKCGAFEFKCGKENLFAGVLEAIYLMRCTLFHGELAPTKDAVACYEPAFRIVRRFLDCAT